MTTCTVASCDLTARGHGLCSKHYTRQRRYGDVHATAIIRNDDEARFRSAYHVHESGCWIWQKNRKPFGYGVFWVGKTPWMAHRYSWYLVNGEIPEGMQLNHTCHNPACVNPSHVYPGTQLENMRDMLMAGRRTPRLTGEAAPVFKLTNAQALEVLQCVDETTAALARRYGVSESLIRGIRSGRLRRRLEAEIRA